MIYRINKDVMKFFIIFSLLFSSLFSECSGEPADVVFVLDSSYSIWPPDFDRELQFTENVIKTFNIGPGPDNTRVGVVTFGHGVWPKFYLDSYLGTFLMASVRNFTLTHTKLHF